MVECRVAFSDGREITKSVPLSQENDQALASLAKGLSTLKKEINFILSQQVDKERMLLAKGNHKRPSSTEEDDGEVLSALYVQKIME